jgi:protein-S-isoprenylcysteine O-methyltransferase Ste14
LLLERINLKEYAGIKPWDKLLSPLMSLSISFPIYIVAGLDHHFGWSKVFPVWVNIPGLFLIAFGFVFATWAIAENRFFSSMVRIQLDRGHQVCDSGPYRFVRHPGYAGNALPLAGMVMAFSSLWAIVPVIAALIIIVTRTALEDRTLQAELPGYAEYVKRVRYRLIPGIW